MIWISTMTYLMTEMTYFMTEPGEAALLGCGIQGTLAEVTEEVFLQAAVGGGQAATGHCHQLPVLLVDQAVGVYKGESKVKPDTDRIRCSTLLPE